MAKLTEKEILLLQIAFTVGFHKGINTDIEKLFKQKSYANKLDLEQDETALAFNQFVKDLPKYLDKYK